MPNPVVRPWRDKDELLQVRSLLYPPVNTSPSTRTQSQRLAINIIHTWQRRSPVPHFILSTALLADALLTHDALSGASADAPLSAQQTPFVATAVFATAILRFVTGFCDTAQTGGAKKSMFEVAGELGMPEAWVEMRHEITHGEMPSRTSMETVVREALTWLWERYWVGLYQQSEPAAVTQEQLGLVKERLRALLKARKAEILSPTTSGSTYAVVMEAIITAADLDASVRCVADVMVSEKLLLPSSKSYDRLFA